MGIGWPPRRLCLGDTGGAPHPCRRCPQILSPLPLPPPEGSTGGRLGPRMATAGCFARIWWEMARHIGGGARGGTVPMGAVAVLGHAVARAAVLVERRLRPRRPCVAERRCEGVVACLRASLEDLLRSSPPCAVGGARATPSCVLRGGGCRHVRRRADLCGGCRTAAWATRLGRCAGCGEEDHWVVTAVELWRYGRSAVAACWGYILVLRR